MENKIYSSPKVVISVCTEDVIRTSLGGNELPPAFTGANFKGIND